ncbi:MAG: ATP-binding protein, partial [Flavitalea sp.]
SSNIKTETSFADNDGVASEIRSFDWSATSVGPREQWPQSLRTSLGIVMNMNIPAFLWWGADHVQFYNDAYKQIFIESKIHPAAIGHRARKSWGKSWQHVLPLVNDVFGGTGASWPEKLLSPRPIKNNHNHPTSFAASPIIDEIGRVSGILVICNQSSNPPLPVNSKNKARLTKMSESERLAVAPVKKLLDLVSILDSSPEFIGMMDIEGNVQYANPTALKTLGWDNYEGRSVWDASYPEDRNMIENIIEQCLAKGFVSAEVRFKNAKTNQTFWLKWNLVVNRDAVTGEIIGLSSVSQNVTDLRKMQRSLIESEARFRNIVAQSPLPIALTRGKDVVIESINEPMLFFMGKGGQNVIGKKMIEVLPELEHQAVLKIVGGVLETGEVFQGTEVPIKLVMDGELQQFYFNLTYSPLIEDGNITGVLHSAYDVTHQVVARMKIEENEAELKRRVEERTDALMKVNTELKRSNQQLEEFAYAASHDLKEPIRKIQIFTNHLKTQLKPKLEPKDETLMDRVVQASVRMGSLVEDLLTYSHVSQKPPEPELVDLNERIRAALEDLELKITEKQAVIHVDKLPVIEGFTRQLQQLFLNLISNALKYNKPGIAPEINITVAEVNGGDSDLPLDNYYKITVRDNGIGFEPEMAEKIFQMFQRLHNARQYEGTGVGLSIARKIVENHHGKLTAESEPGAGASFYLWLPYKLNPPSITKSEPVI